jgi:Tfp pilus assembly protein PilZ
MKQDDNRRTAPRFPLDLQATLRCPNWQTAERIATANVSRGGMFLRTERPPAIGAKIQVTLELPDGRLVEVQSVVRHIVAPEEAKRRGRAPGVGVQTLPEYTNEFKALVEIARLRQGKPAVPSTKARLKS